MDTPTPIRLSVPLRQWDPEEEEVVMASRDCCSKKERFYWRISAAAILFTFLAGLVIEWLLGRI